MTEVIIMMYMFVIVLGVISWKIRHELDNLEKEIKKLKEEQCQKRDMQ